MCLSCGMSLICFAKGFAIIKQVLPLREGDMTICSPLTGHIALGQSPASGEQIVMSTSLKGNNCIIWDQTSFTEEKSATVEANVERFDNWDPLAYVSKYIYMYIRSKAMVQLNIFYTSVQLLFLLIRMASLCLCHSNHCFNRYSYCKNNLWQINWERTQ